MHRDTLKEITTELTTHLAGRFLGRVFQLSPNSLAIDFGLKSAGYLFVSIDPAAPRLYLIKRTSRELEKMSTAPSPFITALRANFGGGKLLDITLDDPERVLRFSFSVADEMGEVHSPTLIVQLTGRSSNLFLLNDEGRIAHALRAPIGAGQQPGDVYQTPSGHPRAIGREEPISRGDFSTLSAAHDYHYRQLEVEHDFAARASDLIRKLRKEITKRKKLRANLERDLVMHGDPAEHKRMGDLLLANISNAVRTGNQVKLNDYYAEGAPVIEIEVDENVSLQDAAGELFSRYAKAKRAIEEVGARLTQTDVELAGSEAKLSQLEAAIERHDVDALAEFDDAKPKAAATKRQDKPKDSAAVAGMRRYRSSDGYEVLVGRSARDNDQLTFKVARPNDLWMHAGDYPGSHVIIRNSSKKEIPQRTVIEAAQLAAKFSQAGKDSKVTIHFTPRKFISKPKGAAPGLVRMSSFKSITVEPGETMERV